MNYFRLRNYKQPSSISFCFGFTGFVCSERLLVLFLVPFGNKPKPNNPQTKDRKCEWNGDYPVHPELRPYLNYGMAIHINREVKEWRSEKRLFNVSDNHRIFL
jgi:hypothetical protein